jgi:hypothetical protein
MHILSYSYLNTSRKILLLPSNSVLCDLDRIAIMLVTRNTLSKCN